MASSVAVKEVMLRVHPDLAKVPQPQNNRYLEELEEVLLRRVLEKSDALLHHEKFNLPDCCGTWLLARFARQENVD